MPRRRFQGLSIVEEYDKQNETRKEKELKTTPSLVKPFEVKIIILKIDRNTSVYVRVSGRRINRSRYGELL